VQKDTIIKLRIATEDALAIKAKAAESGMKVSEFVRRAALAKRLPPVRHTLVVLDAEDAKALGWCLSLARMVEQTESNVAAQARIEGLIARLRRE